MDSIDELADRIFSAIEAGFVKQHDLHLEFDDGRSSDIPSCAAVMVGEGKVTRIDEYLDGSTAAAAFSAG
jgi:hypothetical protein